MSKEKPSRTRRQLLRQFSPCKDDSHSLLCTEYRFGKVRIHVKTLNLWHDWNGRWVWSIEAGPFSKIRRPIGLYQW